MYQRIILLFLAYTFILIVMSVLAFLLYGKDKKMAGNGTEVRIKEKALLSVSSFGGALGAFVGRRVFRHKTNKTYFSFVIYVSLFLQTAVFAFLALNAVWAYLQIMQGGS